MKTEIKWAGDTSRMSAPRRRIRVPRGGSALEHRFHIYWCSINGPALVREHGFHGSRKWRFDFAHLQTKVAVEMEGGSWSNGAHSRGAHFQSDCEKYNAAIMRGWRVFRLTTDMIKVQVLEEIKSFIRKERREHKEQSGLGTKGGRA